MIQNPKIPPVAARLLQSVTLHPKRLLLLLRFERPLFSGAIGFDSVLILVVNISSFSSSSGESFDPRNTSSSSSTSGLSSERSLEELRKSIILEAILESWNNPKSFETGDTVSILYTRKTSDELTLKFLFDLLRRFEPHILEIQRFDWVARNILGFCITNSLFLNSGNKAIVSYDIPCSVNVWLIIE